MTAPTQGEPPHLLLLRRRFAPLFGIQFGGALNDNVLRNAVVALVTFGALSDVIDNRALLVQAVLGLFILPFFLFSATAGRLADDCPDRRRAIQVIKAAEIGTVLLAAVALLTGMVWLLLVAVCCAGVQSAFFGPFKYALLPELLAKDELLAGNGLLNASTYLAILLGIYWGTGLGATATPGLINVVLVALAVAGFACAFWFPAAPGHAGSGWRASWSWNFLGATGAVVRELWRQPRVAWLVAFISWFWASGAVITAQLPVYVRDVAGYGHETYLFLLLVVCVGIACGSLAAVAVLRARVSVRWVPAGMVVSGCALLLLPDWPEADLAELGTLTEFLAAPLAWRTGLVLAVSALGMGFYVVPLYAAMQLAAPALKRGRMVAANNIANALLIVVLVLLAGIFLGLIDGLGTAMQVLFATLGLVTVVLAPVFHLLVRD